MSDSTCSVTMYDRVNWYENSDPGFLKKRHEAHLLWLSKPADQPVCEDADIGSGCCRRGDTRLVCSNCSAWTCNAHSRQPQTYSGEFVRLCTRCQVMLTMSESEMLAIVHAFANERQFVDDMPFSMGNEAEQSVLAAGQGASFSTAVATAAAAAAAAAAASVTESAERTLMAMEDKATPLVEEVAAVAAYQNWTFDECNAHPGLFDHLAKTEHVRFGDKDTKVVTAQEVERYEREEDNRPWATAEDVAPALAGGLFSSLPRYSKRMAVFGMAAAAVGLIAWGARRR